MKGRSKPWLNSHMTWDYVSARWRTFLPKSDKVHYRGWPKKQMRSARGFQLLAQTKEPAETETRSHLKDFPRPHRNQMFSSNGPSLPWKFLWKHFFILVGTALRDTLPAASRTGYIVSPCAQSRPRPGVSQSDQTITISVSRFSSSAVQETIGAKPSFHWKFTLICPHNPIFWFTPSPIFIFSFCIFLRLSENF